MCENCGCSVDHHDHEHRSGHHHEHETINFGHESLLSLNDRLAASNRSCFAEKGCTVVNIVSSPGSGKTALLERTLRDLQHEFKMAVIVGDLATDNDAARLRSTRAPAIQITTGSACHLDAHMIHHALDELDLEGTDILFIENVGNLVCPASFDLGEDAFVVLHSTTEGEDKPLKYPVIFQKAHAVVVSKIDLASAVEFDRAAAVSNVSVAAPNSKVFETSAKTGSGMDDWYAYLRSLVAAKRGIHA